MEGCYKPFHVRAARDGTDWRTRAMEQINILRESFGRSKREDGH